MLLFKVLTHDARPANSDARATGYIYELPQDGTPADWTTPVSRIEACSSGYHLTTRPSRYWVAGARLFVAEARGQMDFHGGDKVACESIRLLEEVTPEWHWLPLYPEARALLYSTWRLNHPDDERPDWANLSRANLSGANLSRANLSRANLSGANLSRADLSRADLSRANLSGADLSRADLSRANLSGAYLSRADLSRADLSGAYLSRANLSGADLSRADLSRADRLTLPEGWELDEDGYARRKAQEEA